MQKQNPPKPPTYTSTYTSTYRQSTPNIAYIPQIYNININTQQYSQQYLEQELEMSKKVKKYQPSNSNYLDYSLPYIGNSMQSPSRTNSLNMSTQSFSGSPVGRTQYICLTNQDLIYFGNFNRFSSQHFRIIVRKITKDLNMLLHFKYQDFWTQLKTNQSLTNCLKSCLQILPRRMYSPHTTLTLPLNQTQNQTSQFSLPTQLYNSECFKLFEHLQRIVLFIYHRMICQSHQQEKDIIYDQWLFDLPKMFNLIAIYKHTNEKIVKNIIDSAFQLVPTYREDVLDFVAIFATTIMDGLTIDLKFQYNKKIFTDCKNFNNAVLSFTRNLIKSFFRAYDIYNLLIDFLHYFPVPYIILLLSQPDLLIELIDRYFQYMVNITQRWQFIPEFQTKFSPVMEAIRQKMLQFFVRAFDAIHYVLSNYADVDRDRWIDILKVYFIICKQFIKRNQSPSGNKWQILIHTIIQQNPHKKVFLLTQQIKKYLSPHQQQLIKECLQYEQEYRKQLTSENFNKNEIIQLKLNSIKSYKQWLDFQNFKSFDLMVEDQFFDMTIKEDSILLLMETEMFKMHGKNQERKRKGKKRRGWGIFGVGDDLMYEDQPVEEDGEIDNYCYPFGMEPIHDEEEPQNSKPEKQANQTPRQQQRVRKQQNYSKYYNSGQKQQLMTSGMKKFKKTYVCIDDLSIGYQKPKQQPSSNIVIEQVLPIVKSNIFKSDPNQFQQQSIKDKTNQNISLSIIQQQDESDQNMSLQNILQHIQISDLSLIDNNQQPGKGYGNQEDFSYSQQITRHQTSNQKKARVIEQEQVDLSLSYAVDSRDIKNGKKEQKEQQNSPSNNNQQTKKNYHDKLDNESKKINNNQNGNKNGNYQQVDDHINNNRGNNQKKKQEYNQREHNRQQRREQPNERREQKRLRRDQKYERGDDGRQRREQKKEQDKQRDQRVEQRRTGRQQREAKRKQTQNDDFQEYEGSFMNNRQERKRRQNKVQQKQGKEKEETKSKKEVKKLIYNEGW